jgi:hypothetical protein
MFSHTATADVGIATPGRVADNCLLPPFPIQRHYYYACRHALFRYIPAIINWQGHGAAASLLNTFIICRLGTEQLLHCSPQYFAFTIASLP